MRRIFIFMLAVCGLSNFALGQSSSSDQQTLQAILAEVKSLRQDLRASLARVQSAQILLARLQMQQGTVARASEHLDETRAKLSETQSRQKEVAGEVKRLEEALSTEENVQQQKVLQDRINHVKTELEMIGEEGQQRQATEIQATQRMRSEQDRLSTIETELDQLMRAMGTSAEQPNR